MKILCRSMNWQLDQRNHVIHQLGSKYHLTTDQVVLLRHLSEDGTCNTAFMDDFRVITQLLREEGFSYQLTQLTV